MTAQQLVTMAQEVADAVGSPRWSTSTILSWIGLEQWINQAKLLNANNQYYNNNVTPTQDANGQFDVSSLTSGTGDTAKNFYRVLLMSQPNSSVSTAAIYYRETSMILYPPPQPSTSLPYVWYRMGTKIQILPAVSGQQMSAYVSYRPPRADQLSAVSVTVDYPDGYESGLAFGAGARMLSKGGAETGAATDLRAMAQDILDNMLLDLGRMSTKPIIALAMDDASAWGSGI